jgi:hypothetical protein
VKPRRTRIDAPHPAAGEPNAGAESDSRESVLVAAGEGELAGEGQSLLEVEEPTEAMIAAVAGNHPEIRREQLQLQVAQLAGHLRERMRELDRREATFNARVAQLESELRASRLWVSERELAFQEREKELLRRIEELEENAEAAEERPETITIDVEARMAELNEREQELRLREDDLRERRFEVDRQAAALRHAQQLGQHEREREQAQLAEERRRFEADVAEWRKQFEQDCAATHEKQEREFDERIRQREDQLAAAEAILDEQSRALERDRVAMIAERQAWDEQKTRQRQAIEDLRKSAEEELADRRMRLEARQQWIERQKAGLEQVRDEALRLHRQSLEMRLLAEQVWSQITASLAPAEVTQAIAELRLKLAEQYKVEEQLLVQRRTELMELSEKLEQQHREVSQIRDGVRQWGHARQAEIERQAAALVQRELALDAQQEEFRTREQHWNDERRRYEQQIREMSARLRSLPVAA